MFPMNVAACRPRIAVELPTRASAPGRTADSPDHSAAARREASDRRYFASDRALGPL